MTIFDTFLGKPKNPEKGRKPEQAQEAMVTHPFLEDILQANTYDGNKAFQRDKWQKGMSHFTLDMLVDAHKRNGPNAPHEKLIRALTLIEKFRDEHDFDMRYAKGRTQWSRSNLFTPSIKEKIIEDIIKGKLTTYDERYLSKVVQGGSEGLLQIKEATRLNRERMAQEDEKRQERVQAYEAARGNQEHLLTTECPVAVIETHTDEQANMGFEYFDKALPAEMPKRFLKINYREGAVAGKSGSQGGNWSEQETRRTIVDRSGEIEPAVLKQLIKKDEPAHFILTGGNLRGCLGASFDSIVKVAQAEHPRQLDIDLPLDQCYDNHAYDGIGKLPTDKLRSLPGVAYEIYHNGKLIDVPASQTDTQELRIRLYLWSKSEVLTKKLTDEVEIKKIKQEINL